MKNILKTGLLAFIAMAISFTSCNEDDPATPADDSRYMQEDQMARPAKRFGLSLSLIALAESLK